MKHVTQCIICGKTNTITLFQNIDRMFDIPGRFVIKKCTQCSLMFIDPQPPASVLKKHYPSSKYYSYQREDSDLLSKLRVYLIKHYYNPTIISRLFSLLIQKVPALPNKKQGKILDVGCGTGDTLLLLKELGWDVYGLEIDRNAVNVAQKRGLKNVKYGTYEDLKNYPNNFFDAIRLYHVIEHLPNPSQCIQLIYKKLKPGGEIILGTPNNNSITCALFGKFWFNLDTPRHLFLFTPFTLSKLVLKEDFSQIQVEFCSAGGIIGSVLYLISHLTEKKFPVEKLMGLFFLFYPFEWILDKLKIGDIIILRAVKTK